MKLGDFLDRIKLQNPNLGQQNITDSYLITLIGQGVNEANIQAQVYKGFTEFNVEAGQRIYSLAENAPLYLGQDKKGLYIKDSNDEWQKITPKTEDWISKQFPDFLNVESVDIPLYYGIDGDDLIIYPPALTSDDSGFRLYHIKKANPMTTNDHYPFSGNKTELTALLPIDDAILAYCRWKLSPQYGNVTDVDLRQREFYLECRKASLKIKAKRAQTNDNQGMTVL